jgi:hypothetical protein
LTRTQHTIQKKTLASKHSSVLTKNVNMTINSMNTYIENLILSSPFLQQNTQYVPLVLSLMYGVRKSVVIDKYEALVRSVNNFTRRKLGQSITPTKLNPLELILSGKIRPIIRRDLLLSNILLILAYMKDDIAREVHALIKRLDS